MLKFIRVALAFIICEIILRVYIEDGNFHCLEDKGKPETICNCNTATTADCPFHDGLIAA